MRGVLRSSERPPRFGKPRRSFAYDMSQASLANRRTYVLPDLTKTAFCAIVPTTEHLFYGGALPGTWRRTRNGAHERCSPQQVASTVFFCILHTCEGAA